MALMFKLADRLESGVIGINEVAPAAPQAPFGGVKQSGVGREGGWQVLDAYTETKMVSIVL
jgi:succinate-semialdehyde dehydrogenase/glutarate-semialdehyde dehydrogenase